MADLVVTAANVVWQSGSKEWGVSGASLTPGMSVYRKASDSKWYGMQHDGTQAESGYGVKIGICLTTSAANQPVCVQYDGSISFGAILTSGERYYVGAGTGGICAVADIIAGEYVTFLGVATSTSLMSLKPFASGVVSS